MACVIGSQELVKLHGWQWEMECVALPLAFADRHVGD